MNPTPMPQPIPTPAPAMGVGGGMPMPPAQPMMGQGGMQPPPTFASGGETPPSPKANPLKDFFSDINLVEVGILALGVATFMYAIYYYKFEMTMAKTGYADLSARMQKLESAEAKRKAEQNAVGKSAMKTRKRILI